MDRTDKITTVVMIALIAVALIAIALLTGEPLTVQCGVNTPC